MIVTINTLPKRDDCWYVTLTYSRYVDGPAYDFMARGPFEGREYALIRAAKLAAQLHQLDSRTESCMGCTL